MAVMTDKQFDDDEITLESKFKSVLKKQTNSFIAYANKNGIDNAIQAIDSIIKVDALRTAYISVFIKQGEGIANEIYKDLIKISVKREAPASISAGFFSDLWQKYVIGYANRLDIANRITKINDTTKQSIKYVIAKNPLNGSGRVSLDIKKEIAGINANRALLIARTELTHINNTASQFGAEQSETTTGVLLEKGWSARIDGRERPEHATANGQFVALKKNFIVGGVEMSHPGDPKGGAENVCNCRCAMTHRVAKQIELPELETVKPVIRDGNFISNLVAYVVSNDVLALVE